jgi:hypothetical protein
MLSRQEANAVPPRVVDILGAEVRFVDTKSFGRTRIAEAGRGDRETLVFLHGIGGHLEAYSRNVAPAPVKRYAQQLVNFGQSPAGMIMIDDTENFERARDNMLSALHRQDAMGELALSNEAPGNAEYLEDFAKAGVDLKRVCPTGEVLPGVQEKASRAFYRVYKNLMLAK